MVQGTGAHFIMEDGSQIHHTRGRSHGGGVTVTGGGTFTMLGGEIHNSLGASTGGGVYILTNGLFIMGDPQSPNTNPQLGPRIHSNRLSGSTALAREGGGVAARGNNAVFRMYGGVIGVYIPFNPVDTTPFIASGANAGFNPRLLTQANLEDNGGNRAARGGGVAIVRGASLFLNGGHVAGNAALRATYAGGGIILTHATSLVEMNGGIVHGNHSAGSGGGVFIQTRANFVMNSGAINANRSRRIRNNGGGGGVVNRGFLTMHTGSYINHNYTPNTGGGVRMRNSGTLTMYGGGINYNHADGGGGVFMARAGSGTVLFVMYGGELNGNISRRSSTQSINTSRNQWRMYGGGVLIDAGTFHIRGDATKSISGNIARTDLTTRGGDGGGIYWFGAGGNLNVIANEGLVIIDGNTAYRHGGGIHIGGSGFNAYMFHITNNHAQAGGGIHSGDASAGHTMSFYRSRVDFNTSDISGAGIHSNAGTVTFENSTLNNNTATLRGGGIYINPTGGRAAHVRLLDSDVSGNRAGLTGGGIMPVGNNSTVVAYNSNINGNSAGYRGGGVFMSNGDITLNGSRLNDNWVDGESASGAILNDSGGGGIFITNGNITLNNTTHDVDGVNVYLRNGDTEVVIVSTYVIDGVTTTIASADINGERFYIDESA